MTTCPLCCCDPCNPAIDAAVTRVHQWFRAGILDYLAEPAAPTKRTGQPWPSDNPDSERLPVKRKRAEVAG